MKCFVDVVWYVVYYVIDEDVKKGWRDDAALWDSFFYFDQVTKAALELHPGSSVAENFGLPSQTFFLLYLPFEV